MLGNTNRDDEQERARRGGRQERRILYIVRRAHKTGRGRNVT